MSKKTFILIIIFCLAVIFIAGLLIATSIAKNKLTTIQGEFIIEPKTHSWLVGSTFLLFSCGKDCQYVGKTVKATGYIYKEKCPPGYQCWSGNYMKVKSIEIIGDKIVDSLYCVNNENCSFTYYPIDNCCYGCETYAISKAGLRQQVEWRKNHGCDIKKCPLPQCREASSQKSECVNNWCILQPDKISISTDKNYYLAGEKIEIIITNHGTDDLCFDPTNNFLVVERLDELSGQWQRIHSIPNLHNDCYKDVSLQKIFSNNTNCLKVLANSSINIFRDCELTPGRYRLIQEVDEGKLVQTLEFIVKEN